MFNDVLQEIMVLEWKERGHEAEDHQVAQDLECINAMRNCGLLKFFRTRRLRAQMELFLYLISLWDFDQKIFIIKGQELVMEEIDIYFINGLSRRGQRVQLFGSRPGGESTSGLIRKHFPGLEMTMGGKVKKKKITNPPLRNILFTIARIYGMQALHEASQSQLRYAVDCLTPTVFNWCGGLLDNMKRQLTKGK